MGRQTHTKQRGGNDFEGSDFRPATSNGVFCRISINGKVAELGVKYGIKTPYNNAVVRMVKAKEVFGPR